MTSYVLSHQAYLNIALHAAKYPHKSVNGVLVGYQVDTNRVEITTAIPLLHRWTSLSPMMEIGLDMARMHALSQGKALVGYYQASDDIHDRTLVPVGERVTLKLREDFPNCIALVLDGEKFGSGQPALVPFTFQGSSFRSASGPTLPFTPSSPFSLASRSTPMRALQLIREDLKQELFGDFDDHLEDISVDWLDNLACREDEP